MKTTDILIPVCNNTTCILNVDIKRTYSISRINKHTKRNQAMGQNPIMMNFINDTEQDHILKPWGGRPVGGGIILGAVGPGLYVFMCV